MTFPYMSGLRKLKTFLGAYPLDDPDTQPEDFYQFAFDKNFVIDAVCQKGFALVEEKPFDPEVGLREECPRVLNISLSSPASLCLSRISRLSLYEFLPIVNGCARIS